MRKLLFLFLLLPFGYLFTGSSVTVNNSDITNYYYYKDQPFYLQLKADALFIELENSMNEAELNSFVRDVIPEAQVHKYDNGSTKQFITMPSLRSNEAINNLVVSLNSKSGIKNSSPVFSPDNGTTLIGVENQVILQFKSNFNEQQAQEYINQNNFTVIQKIDLKNALTYLVEIPQRNNETAIDIANDVYNSGKVNWAEPNLFFTNVACYMPNDAFVNMQWSIKNTGSNIPGTGTGTAGCDMQIDSAWEKTLGSNKVIVAISDTGCDTLHEDLAANFVPGTGYNFFNNTPGGNDDGNHGTACAGIVAAIGNNSIGISGVAPNSKLIAVKWMSSAGSGNYAGAANTEIYAYQKGAWISSNSWGFVGGASSLVDNAINDATTLGRNGKGMVCVFASGNENGTMRYPAISHPKLIVVGGITPCNQRKTTSDCSGETWGASYGPTLDIVAPCVKIYTTDRTGSVGYTTGNYQPIFNGTSSATPNVAGVCALMLAADSSLRWDTVRAYIGRTAQKVGSYSYTTPKAYGNWNNEMGYGKINGYLAVKYTLEKKINFALSAFGLQNPTASAIWTSIPGSGITYTANWDTSATGASYKFIFGSPTSATRQITLPSGLNSLTLTAGQLDVLLAGLGVAQGGQLVGQWDVWAYRPNPPANDSLKAGNGPRAITLRRGVPLNIPVNLLNPNSNTTIVTAAHNTSNVNFRWSKSGEGVSYKWMFDSPNFTGQPLLSYPASGSGFDTSVSIANSTLDGVLAGLGLNKGDSLVGQWRVYAFRSPSDSTVSNQTFNVTFKRQSKGDILVMYDSGSVNGRISRDSILSGLNSRALNYDIFNRGLNTSTNGISLRGYKKVILLGEGTSVCSNKMKDSIKAYLNSGGTSISTKSKLIIFGDDVGYHWGRVGSTYLDGSFVSDVLGWTFVVDVPAGSSGTEGLRGVKINTGLYDSTSGPRPDVLAKSTASSVSYLYEFARLPGQYNGIGRMANNYNIATIAVDFESLRNAIGGASGSAQQRFLNGAMDYVDQLIPTNIVDPLTIPTEYDLAQNFPNPFNPSTKISFAIPEQGFVSMKVYDITGKMIANLVNETKTAGHYSVDFNAVNLASGIYFYKLESKNFVSVKRMMLIK